MAAYLISQVGAIADQSRYDRYVKAATELVAQFSGRMLANGSDAEILEGMFEAGHIVVFEFPSMENIHALWNSPAYRAAKKLREGIAPTNAVALPGLVAGS